MRKKRSILPSFTVLALTAVLLVLSCSHGGGGGSEDESGQVSESDDNQASQSDNPSDDSQAKADTSDNATGDDGLAPPSKDDQVSPKSNDDALTELESTVSDPKNPPGDAELNPNAPSNAGDASTTTASTTTADQTAGAPMDQTATAQADQTQTPPPAPTDAAAQTPVAETAPPIVEPMPPIAGDNKPAESPTVADATAPAPKKHHGHKAHKNLGTEARVGRRGIEAPKIPGSAITKKGTNLNRFYFARKGDNPKQLSQLLYGNPDRAKDLLKWNGASSWKPGSVIYYSSPVDANDTKMQAFYQERNVPVEEYTVDASDTIFSIAEKKLGDKRSWKEIAAVNGMENSNGIEAGQKLALYAADLSQFTPDKATNTVAQNVPPKPPVPDNTAGANPNQPPQQAAPPEAAPPIEPPPPPPKPIAAPQHSNGFDMAQMIQQNIFAVGIGGVILVLLVTLMALNRKKKAGQEEFGDENFNSPRARRK